MKREAGEHAGSPGRPSGVRLVRSCLAFALLPVVLPGCPKKPAPADGGAPVAETTVGAGPAGDAGAPDPVEWDASVPDKAEVVLETDWIHRAGDAPAIVYDMPGLPAVSPEGQLVVVPFHEANPFPSLQLVVLRAQDEQRTNLTAIQTAWEYSEALYPPYADRPTRAITDARFRDLFQVVGRRIAAANAQLAAWTPLRKCHIEEPDKAGEDAGVDAGSPRPRQVIRCPGLQITYDRHRLRVVGRGGNVRYERKTSWRRPSWVYPTRMGAMTFADSIESVHGDAAHGVLVVRVTYDVTPKYYGRGAEAEWHVVRLD